MVPSLMDVRLPEEFLRTIRQHPSDPPDPSDPSDHGGTTAHRPDGAAWLRSLPGLLDSAARRWGLRADPAEPVRWGSNALVLPVLRPQGDPGALKVGWPHAESDVEHLALRAWRGRGAVRLLAAEPGEGSLLLERLDAGRDLTSGGVPGASEALGGVLRALDRPASPWAEPLSQVLGRLATRFAEAADDPADAHLFPRRMVRHALSVTRDLLAEGDLDERLVHSDLHQANVLWRPDPGEWVAIDPKVVAGDPHWAVAPGLWNRWSDALAAPDLGSHLLLRLDAVCDSAGLDRDRAREMAVVRLVDNALWSLRAGRDDAREQVTRSVAIVKAMQRG